MSSTSLVFDILARDRSSTTFDRVGGAANRAGGHLSGLGSKLKTVARYGALAAAAGAVLAVRWGVDAVKAAAADEQAQKILANALKRNTDATSTQVAAVEEWIAKQGVALGVADDDLRPAYQRLAEATGSVSKAQDLASIAMDVAAGKGKTTKQVAEALGKAYEGNIGALGRLGVKTKDAEGNTLTFDQAVKGLADTFGGQAATKADTYQGKMDRLKVVYNETKEAIGAKLLPVLTDLATWFLEKGIPGISKTWSWLKEKLGPAFEAAGDFIDRFRGAGAKVSEGVLPKLREGFATVKDAVRDAGPFIDLVKGALANLEPVITNVVWPAFMKLKELQFGGLMLGLRGIGKILGWIGTAGKAMWNQALLPVFRFMADAIATVLEKLGAMFSALGSIKGAPPWIGETGDALLRAADAARKTGDELREIPTTKRVDIFVQTHYQGTNIPGTGLDLPSRGAQRPAPRTSGRRVMGTPSGRFTAGADGGGLTPETIRAALEGMMLTIVDGDAGRRAYLTAPGAFS